ncbi:MAG: sulfotransferase family protein [Calditrichia bacterium]
MQYNFLICSERSGSNLFTRLMNGHSQVCGPSPTHLCRHLWENRSAYCALDEDENWQRLTEDGESLFRTMTGVWKSDWATDRINALTKRSLAELLRTVFQHEGQANNKSTVLIKENHAWRMLDLLWDIQHDARFIWLVRDPRDMALSWKRSPILRRGVIRAGQIWKEDQQQMLLLADRVFTTENLIQVHYEKLVSAPEETLTRVCDFLNLNFEPSMLTKSSRAGNTLLASRATDWKNLAGPLLSNNFGKYRTGLTEEEICYLEQLCGDEMVQLGYSLDMDKGMNVEDLEQLISPLELYDKPGYQNVPEEEKQIRLARAEVVGKIKKRALTLEMAT